jgi:hypothetical protein
MRVDVLCKCGWRLLAVEEDTVPECCPVCGRGYWFTTGSNETTKEKRTMSKSKAAGMTVKRLRLLLQRDIVLDQMPVGLMVDHKTKDGIRPLQAVELRGETVILWPDQPTTTEPLAITLLREAVARVEIANAEGDKILSAWLPEAKKLIQAS